MAESTRSSFKNKKVQIFFIFLIAAFLIWLVSKMSETYTDNAKFSLVFENVPDSLYLTRSSTNTLDVRVRTTGFQFLAMGLKNLEVKVDLTTLDSSQDAYFMPPSAYRRQIESQISDNIDLLEVADDTLYFNFIRVFDKKVPVHSNITLKMSQDHLLEGPLEISPGSITLRGPKAEIDTVTRIYTEARVMENVTEDFAIKLGLTKPESMAHTSFSEETVSVKGAVFRFSEAVFEVPIQVLNLPEGTEIKTFPGSIKVLCKARVERLKELNPQEIKLVADYAARRSDEQIIQVRLLEKPEDVYSVELLQNKIEFILRRL